MNSFISDQNDHVFPRVWSRLWFLSSDISSLAHTEVNRRSCWSSFGPGGFGCLPNPTHLIQVKWIKCCACMVTHWSDSGVLQQEASKTCRTEAQVVEQGVQWWEGWWTPFPPSSVLVSMLRHATLLESRVGIAGVWMSMNVWWSEPLELIGCHVSGQLCYTCSCYQQVWMRREWIRNPV